MAISNNANIETFSTMFEKEEVCLWILVLQKYMIHNLFGQLWSDNVIQREDNSGRCPCIAAQRREKIQGISTVPAGGYPKNDQRWLINAMVSDGTLIDIVVA